MTNVLDLGLIVGEAQIFDEAAMKICNELASQFEAMRVSIGWNDICLLYTSPSPRDRTRSRMPSSA